MISSSTQLRMLHRSIAKRLGFKRNEHSKCLPEKILVLIIENVVVSFSFDPSFVKIKW